MYLLDSNVFIEAKQRYYGLDFSPAFWDWLDRSFKAQALASIDRIGQELRDRNDDLTVWAKQHKHIFLPVDAATQPSFQKLSAWTMDPSLPYSQEARFTFMAKGDYQLVAYAHAHGYVVVTHEVAAPQAKKIIKIPDACGALGVTCADLFAVIRETNAKFVLAGDPGSR